MILTEKDLESRGKFIKVLKKQLDRLKKSRIYYAKRALEDDKEVKGLSEILDALEDAELMEKELKNENMQRL